MSNAENYCIQSKNSTSVNILRSWLHAVGIETSVPKTPGFDLSIPMRLGGELNVAIAMRQDETLAGEGVSVMASDFTGRQDKVALSAFYKITDAAGYNRIPPLDRGAHGSVNDKGNPRKLHYKDEDFLVAIRHSEFRRSPDPAPDRWGKYRFVMNRIVWEFYQMNLGMCQRQRVDIDDVMQYARCAMVNFCSRYETPVPVLNDNERKFTGYLRQRLNHDLRYIMTKKERSTTPDGETVCIALFSHPNVDTQVSPDPSNAYALALDNPKALEIARAVFRGEREAKDFPAIFCGEKVDHDYIARNCELDVTSVSRRRASADVKLTELLAGMPHSDMVSLLHAAAVNSGYDHATRKEATRRVREHEGACSLCQVGTQEEEESTSKDSLSA